MELNKYYGLNSDIMSFAVNNQYTTLLSKAAYALGAGLTPFCFFAREAQVENGVVDFSNFNGASGDGRNVGQEIYDYRKSVYREQGLFLERAKMSEKYALVDYLLTVALCYVEIPKYVTKEGMAQQAYDKFLCTRNPHIMQAWMGGENVVEFQSKYSGRIRLNQVDLESGNIRLVKMNSSQKGNSITVPRGVFDIESMQICPVFMYYAFIQGIKGELENSIIEFMFMKDNGQIRTLATTLNYDILMDYYNDNSHVSDMLQQADVDSVQQGSMTLPSKMARGYVRLPELGSSKYDSGVRSLNLSRIVHIRKVEEVDRSFINVNLDAVQEVFNYYVDGFVVLNPHAITDVCAQVLGQVPSEGTSPAVAAEILKREVNSRIIFLSTEYKRSLHRFMVSNPQWFPSYTGDTQATAQSSSSYGIEDFDF